MERSDDSGIIGKPSKDRGNDELRTKDFPTPRLPASSIAKYKIESTSTILKRKIKTNTSHFDIQMYHLCVPNVDSIRHRPGLRSISREVLSRDEYRALALLFFLLSLSYLPLSFCSPFIAFDNNLPGFRSRNLL